jgi:hypothetical protein
MKSSTIHAMTSTVQPSCPKIFGAQPYPLLVDPPRLRLVPGSTTIGQQRDYARMTTIGNCMSSTAPGMFHRPVISIVTSP